MKIKFDPHVTTIVGSSDVGKSSVIRSLRWLARNKPGGDAFVREGQSECKVAVWLDGKRRVSRIKGKGKNEYALKDGEETVSFKAFGADVPDVIDQVFNIGDVNFQQQHDSPFWFSLTAGQVSKELNSVVNLEVIDKTLAEVNSRVRRIRTEVDVSESRKKEAEEKLEGMNWVPEMKEEFVALQEADKEVDELQRKCFFFLSILKKVERLKEEASFDVPYIRHLEQLRNEVGEMKNKSMRWGRMIQNVVEQIDSLGVMENDLHHVKKKLKGLSKENCPVCGTEMVKEK